MNENKFPQVSIIIIFLNGEKFIKEAIESVLSQTYSNWEILLVDDGSTDNSTAIAQKYANQFPNKIHYLNHPNHQNLGMSASRNLGANNAKGKYLISMDADDVLLPDKIERQVAIFQANPGIAMVYGPSLYWYGWSGKKEDIERDYMDNIGVIPDRIYEPPQLMTLYLSGRINGPCTCGMMVDISILKSIGGWENNFRTSFEHQVLVDKIVLNYPVYVEKTTGDKYRQHSGMNSIKTTDKELNNTTFIYLKWLSQYISQKGIKNSNLNTALKKVLSFRKIKTIIKNTLPNNVLRYLKTLRKF